MGRLSKALRFEVLTRDGYKCRYCGAGAGSATLHIDHVLPRAAGGRDDICNLVTACADCNSGKSDRKILGIPDGFALTPDKRPVRMEKMRRVQEAKTKPDNSHDLNCDNIDDLDEIDDDDQLALVWCMTHEQYEWHYVDRDYIRSGGVTTSHRKPLWANAR